MIDRSLIEKVEEMAAVQTLEIDDRRYTTKPIYPVLDPSPKLLELGTLTGLVDYIAANIDGLDIPKEVLVQVKSFNQVALLSSLRLEFMTRDCYILARRDDPFFPFEKFLDVESFIIRMQSMFVQDDKTAEILKIVGNIQDGKVSNYKDDGITQQVTAKTGVSIVENKLVPNPVELAPYRTFREIDQPRSEFVLRMRAGADGPTMALFKADGGDWKNKAIIGIREWLKDRVKGIAIIA